MRIPFRRSKASCLLFLSYLLLFVIPFIITESSSRVYGNDNHVRDISDDKRTRVILHNLESMTLNNAISTILDNKCPRIPLKTIFFTIATAGQFDLILLQRASHKSKMSSRSLSCLLQRLIIICLDDLCLKLCAAHRLQQCVLLKREGSLLPPPTQIAKFKERQWNFITYVKWEIVHEAKALGAETVLTFDADLLMFSNPFESSLDVVSDTKYNILHLSETGDGCEAVINSGMLLLRTNQDKTMEVVNEMLRNKNDILNNTGGLLEQDFLVRAIKKTGASRCSFPRTNFTGHCQYAHIDHVPLKYIVSYHVPCTKSYQEKVALMTHFLHAMAIANVANITFNGAELHRNYFNPDHAILDEDKEKYPLEFTPLQR